MGGTTLSATLHHKPVRRAVNGKAVQSPVFELNGEDKSVMLPNSSGPPR